MKRCHRKSLSVAPFWFVWGATVARSGAFRDGCGKFRDGYGVFARVLVGTLKEGVCAGKSVFPGVGGKCAGVLAGNVL